jgi:hypothetical protein
MREPRRRKIALIVIFSQLSRAGQRCACGGQDQAAPFRLPVARHRAADQWSGWPHVRSDAITDMAVSPTATTVSDRCRAGVPHERRRSYFYKGGVHPADGDDDDRRWLHGLGGLARSVSRSHEASEATLNFDQLIEPHLEVIRQRNRDRVFADLGWDVCHFPQAVDQSLQHEVTEICQCRWPSRAGGREQPGERR